MRPFSTYSNEFNDEGHITKSCRSPWSYLKIQFKNACEISGVWREVLPPDWDFEFGSSPSIIRQTGPVHLFRNLRPKVTSIHHHNKREDLCTINFDKVNSVLWNFLAGTMKYFGFNWQEVLPPDWDFGFDFGYSRSDNNTTRKMIDRTRILVHVIRNSRPRVKSSHHHKDSRLPWSITKIQLKNIGIIRVWREVLSLV